MQITLRRLCLWLRWRPEHILWPIYAEIQKVSHFFATVSVVIHLCSIEVWLQKSFLHIGEILDEALVIFITQFVNVRKCMRHKRMPNLFMQSIVSKRTQFVYTKDQERAGVVVDLRSASGIMLHQLGLTMWKGLVFYTYSATASPVFLHPHSNPMSGWALGGLRQTGLEGSSTAFSSGTGLGQVMMTENMLTLRPELCMHCLWNGSKTRLILTQFAWLRIPSVPYFWTPPPLARGNSRYDAK